MIRKLHSLSCVLSFFLSDIIILFERRLRLYDANPLCFPASRGSYRSSSRLFFFIKEYKDKYFSAFKLLWINAWSTDRASGSLGENSLSLKVAISGIVKLIFVSQALNSVSFYCLFFFSLRALQLSSSVFFTFHHHPICTAILSSSQVLMYILIRRTPYCSLKAQPCLGIPVSLFLPAHFCLSQFALLYI